MPPKAAPAPATHHTHRRADVDRAVAKVVTFATAKVVSGPRRHITRTGVRMLALTWKGDLAFACAPAEVDTSDGHSAANTRGARVFARAPSRCELPPPYEVAILDGHSAANTGRARVCARVRSDSGSEYR